MTYDQGTRTFSFYSENEALIGSHEFQLKAYFQDYPETNTIQKSAILRIGIDCPNPTLV